jgi:hypothetical protein
MARKIKDSTGEKANVRISLAVTESLNAKIEVLVEMTKSVSVNQFVVSLLERYANANQQQIKEALSARQGYQTKLKNLATGLTTPNFVQETSGEVPANLSTSAAITADNTQESSDNAK